jgi:hypothetical protein
MVTTIQLSESTKNHLTNLRNSNKQTYEEIIINLLQLAEIQKRKRKDLLIQECKEMAEENLKIAKEGECALMDGLDKNERWEELEEEI